MQTCPTNQACVSDVAVSSCRRCDRSGGIWHAIIRASGTCRRQFLAAIIKVTAPWQGDAGRRYAGSSHPFRHCRLRLWFGVWCSRADFPSAPAEAPDWRPVAWPNAASPKPDVRPAEPASDVSINLDRLLAAANDDRAGRQQPRRPEPPNVQENRRDDDDVAVRALLVELNRLSTHEQAPPHRANFENLGQNRERISR